MYLFFFSLKFTLVNVRETSQGECISSANPTDHWDKKNKKKKGEKKNLCIYTEFCVTFPPIYLTLYKFRHYTNSQLPIHKKPLQKLD